MRLQKNLKMGYRFSFSVIWRSEHFPLLRYQSAYSVSCSTSFDHSKCCRLQPVTNEYTNSVYKTFPQCEPVYSIYQMHLLREKNSPDLDLTIPGSDSQIAPHMPFYSIGQVNSALCSKARAQV